MRPSASPTPSNNPAIRPSSSVIDFDGKRMHYFMTMLHGNERWLAATSEAISICVDMATRRSTAWPADRLVLLRALHETHARRPRPTEIGRRIGIRRK